MRSLRPWLIRKQSGYGGSGTLYKIKLRNREVVAVKKLRSGKAKDSVSDDELFLDKGLKTEVETLGSIRHKNIVKLYKYQPNVSFIVHVIEYAYSSKATTKCDVYSFGVILMELITGKKPVEAEFGENKNIIYGVSTKVKTKEGAKEALDKQASRLFKDEMIKVLRIAIRCTCGTTALRPTMSEVVQLLIEADPCKFDL
ncbi:unnamed protein product [Ilex paraguariensis]|uniref:non-specific serine/threonine protein kinase n=1 Tax=Ilex paraguariensis TaxID=185542 RepID=A0ABC8TVZ0_9AQUA